MSDYDEYEFQHEHTTTVEESSLDIDTTLEQLQLTETTRSFTETMAFSSLKEQYDEVVKRCNELSIKAAAADAQLSTVNGINAKYTREIVNLKAENATANQSIKTIEDEKNEIYVKFKGAEADAEFHRGQHNSKSTRVTQLEEQNRMMRSEHQQFRETIFDLLGMDKSKMTKTSTKDLINVLRSGRHRDPRAEREIAELKAKIAFLESRPLVVSNGSAIDQTLLDSMEERHKLSRQVQEEQHKYSKMVQEVRIYKSEADEQSKRLGVQLQAAYAELEKIQTSLKDVVRLSGLAHTSSTTALAKVDAVRDHKCKYATTIFETYEESSSYTMHRASAPFSPSASDTLGLP